MALSERATPAERGAGNARASFLRRLVQAWRQQQDRVHTEKLLRKLSAQQLKDIGAPHETVWMALERERTRITVMYRSWGG